MDVPTSDHVPLLMKLGLLGGKSTHEEETEWEMTKYKLEQLYTDLRNKVTRIRGQIQCSIKCCQSESMTQHITKAFKLASTSTKNKMRTGKNRKKKKQIPVKIKRIVRLRQQKQHILEEKV